MTSVISLIVLEIKRKAESMLKSVEAHLLCDAVKKENQYKKLAGSLGNYSIKNFRQQPAFVTGLSDTPLAALFSSLCDEKVLQDKTSLIIVPDEKTAFSLYTAISCLLPDVFVFPMRDFVFYNVDAFSHETEFERLEVLRKISDGKARCVICVPEAALSVLPPRENIGSAFTVSVGMEYSLTALLEKLVVYGYAECDTVEGKGQFSHRGDILDIFPPDCENPIRVEFFGDEIDACGYFDIMTQRRIENVMEFEITPSRELLLSPTQKEKCISALESLISNLNKKLSKLDAKTQKTETLSLRENLSSLLREKEMLEDGTLINIDKYLPLISHPENCLLSYVTGGVFAVEYTKCIERLAAHLWQTSEAVLSLITEGVLSPLCSEFCKDGEFLREKMCACPSVISHLFSANPGIEISGLYDFTSKQTSPIGYGEEILFDDIENYNALSYKTVIALPDKKTANALCESLNAKNIRAQVSDAAGYLSASDMTAGLTFCLYDAENISSLRGFDLPNTSFAFLTGTTAEKNTRKRTSSKNKGKTAGQKILSYQDLKVGDYVVHTVHGIARYEGIRTLTVDKITRDYIMLQYAGSDALYIPVDQLDRVSKYAGAGENVKLSSMTSKDWQKAKQKAKRAAKDMAKQLINLYAERTRLKGYAFSADTEWQKDFEADFEFEETEGQINAVDEIKRDMEKPYPMDRLLCGDVGFGKTEVALRAVFKCVIEGKQAAILVPTTILAMQHYRTVLSRMKGFPFKIEMLSRFCKPKEAAAIVKRLETGETDIVIGTHKLLGKTIKFRDLGLLVVDEEQRFGVAHKERLKEISKQVDVLTLTATPIPRTLNMAMAGIRDMSVLEEAPTDRYPVQTYVLEHDNLIILEAIKKELRRAGQVFYLRNRVEGIEETAAKLREALPDAVIACAHGQMSKEELSDIWTDLVAGDIDVLVCTTIIETGVDVPNANTMIIEDADRLGLSQLHQLRGRIGRSNRRAYAYITWKKSACLTEIASKRLEALREFTEFGSGFKIAMRDLEIRGAGNLLGAEQSGHMEAVGYDLYIRILEEAVLEEKGISASKENEVQSSVDLRVNAYIPEKYIRLPGGRIEMYKKIASAKTREEIDEIRDELLDRYGNIPTETENLCEIAFIRSKCAECGIVKIEQIENKLVFYPISVEKSTAVSISLYFKGRVLLSMGQKPCYNIKLLQGENVVSLCREFVTQLEKLSHKNEE